MQGDVRIDKWLWEVRIYKTRSQATEAIRAGRVRILDQLVKPSRLIKAGEIISVNLNPVKKSVRVTGFPQHRVAARLVPDYLEDLTPQEEYDKLKVHKESVFEFRQRGTGRPTKKERRILEILKKRVGE